MSTFLKIVLVEPSLILRSGMSYVLRRLTTFDVQVVETGEPEQLEELIAEAAPDVLIINPSLTDEEMLRELQQKSLRLIAFQSVLADARLMQRFDAVVSIYDTAEQIKEKLRSVCNSRDGEASQELLSAREKDQQADRRAPVYFGAYGHHAPAQYCGQIADTFAGGPDHLCDRQQTGRAERCEKYDLQQRRTITAVIF